MYNLLIAVNESHNLRHNYILRQNVCRTHYHYQYQYQGLAVVSLVEIHRVYREDGSMFC